MERNLTALYADEAMREGLMHRLEVLMRKWTRGDAGPADASLADKLRSSDYEELFGLVDGLMKEAGQ
jgi:hypothetical protein